MNIQVNARQYSTGAGMPQIAKQIRAKLFNPPKKVVDTEPAPVVHKVEEPEEYHSAAIAALEQELDRVRAELSEVQSRLAAAEAILSEKEEKFASRRKAYDIAKDVLEQRFPHITLHDIIGVSRKVNVVRARHEVMWEVHHERPDMSLPTLGRLFNRDHTTILHSIRKIQTMKDTGAIR